MLCKEFPVALLPKSEFVSPKAYQRDPYLLFVDRNIEFVRLRL